MANESQIWKTTDGGMSWTRLSIVNLGTVTSLCVKNDDPQTVWYTVGGYNSVGVRKSTNGGSSWTNCSNGLPPIPVYSIVYNKFEGVSEHLYAGTEVGVYFKDGDNDWVAFNNGLPNVKIGEIELYYDTQNPEACRLSAATYGRGLWESPVNMGTMPVAGTIIGNSIICEENVAQLHLIGFTGNIQWQESLNGTAWEDISGATSFYYETELLTQSKY
jgi:hypothetical protein